VQVLGAAVSEAGIWIVQTPWCEILSRTYYLIVAAIMTGAPSRVSPISLSVALPREQSNSTEWRRYTLWREHDKSLRFPPVLIAPSRPVLESGLGSQLVHWKPWLRVSNGYP
jgi:hypothetical protein